MDGRYRSKPRCPKVLLVSFGEGRRWRVSHPKHLYTRYNSLRANVFMACGLGINNVSESSRDLSNFCVKADLSP